MEKYGVKDVRRLADKVREFRAELQDMAKNPAAGGGDDGQNSGQAYVKKSLDDAFQTELDKHYTRVEPEPGTPSHHVAEQITDRYPGLQKTDHKSIVEQIKEAFRREKEQPSPERDRDRDKGPERSM